jgi:bile acid:Na+ symporter, BASS family
MDAALLTSLLNVATIAMIMFSMGLKANFADVLDTMRKWRIVVGCVVANYVAVPLVTSLLLFWFETAPLISTGFLILATCPGAPVGPPLTALAKGNLPTAIGTMVILACFSAVLTPLLLSWLLGRLAPNGELHIDSLSIIRTLLLVQLLPLGLGLGIQKLAPKFSNRVAGPMSLLGSLLLVILLILILISQFETLATIAWQGWWRMSMLLATALTIGWFSGGVSNETRKALALNTAVRNLAVGLVIVADNFAGTPAVTAVVAYGLLSTIGAVVFASLIGRLMPNTASLTNNLE